MAGGGSLIRVIMTDECINEIRLMVEQENIKEPLIYLDIEGTCCHLNLKVAVVDQTNDKFEIVSKVNDFPISVSDFITNLFEKNKGDDWELKMDYMMPLGFSFQFLRTSNIDNVREYHE